MSRHPSKVRPYRERILMYRSLSPFCLPKVDNLTNQFKDLLTKNVNVIENLIIK